MIADAKQPMPGRMPGRQLSTCLTVYVPQGAKEAQSKQWRFVVAVAAIYQAVASALLAGI